MNPIPSICLIVVLSLFAHQILADLVSDTCNITMFKDVCLTTLRADPSSAKADIHGLVKIALNATAAKSSDIQGKIPQILGSTKDPYTKMALQDCVENYEDASEQISESLIAAESHSYAGVSTWVAAAMTDSDSCEDGLKEGKTYKLADDNKLFSQLCSNVLAICNKASGSRF